jgi:hypothetical protein
MMGRGAVRTKDADGVETVLNGVEPYRINGKAVSLVLEREMSIDTENEAVIKTGSRKDPGLRRRPAGQYLHSCR